MGKFETANTKASFTACTALLQQLFNETIQSKLSSDQGYSPSLDSLEQIREDFASLRTRYLQDAKGPQKQSLLVVFIEDKMGEVMRFIVSRFQEQHEEQMRAKQAEVAAATEKLALQSGREESFKKMLADAQE